MGIAKLAARRRFFGGCAMSAPAAMSVLGANSGHLLPGRRGGRLAVVALDSQVHSRPQLLVLGAIGLTGAYWWFVLVPSARVRLAVNKKSGTLRKYLEELKQDDSRSLEKWFYANWLEKMDPETKYLLREGDEAADGYSVKLSDTGGVQEGRCGGLVGRRNPEGQSHAKVLVSGQPCAGGSGALHPGSCPVWQPHWSVNEYSLERK